MTDDDDENLCDNVSKKHIAILEDKAITNWLELQSSCPSIRKFGTYGEFIKQFSITSGSQVRADLFNDVCKAGKLTRLLNCLLILLFSEELQKLTWAGRNPSVREDAWSIVVAEFLDLVREDRRCIFNVKETMRMVRRNTAVSMRKAAAKRDKKTIEAFCGWQESVYKRGYVSKAVEEASYSELLDYLKARLTPDEFDALLQRCRQEYYLRKSPVPCLKEARDTVTERRAVRKARDLLKNIQPDEKTALKNLKREDRVARTVLKFLFVGGIGASLRLMEGTKKWMSEQSMLAAK